MNPLAGLFTPSTSKGMETPGIEHRLLNIEKTIKGMHKSLQDITISINQLLLEFQSFKQVAVMPAADEIVHGPETASQIVYDPFMK